MNTTYNRTLIIGDKKYYINSYLSLQYSEIKTIEYSQHDLADPLNNQEISEANEAMALGIITKEEVPAPTYGFSISDEEYEELILKAFNSNTTPEECKNIEISALYVNRQKDWDSDGGEYIEEWVHVRHNKKMYKKSLSVYWSFGSGDPRKSKYSDFLSQHPQGQACIDRERKNAEEAAKWNEQYKQNSEKSKQKRVEYLKKKFGKD